MELIKTILSAIITTVKNQRVLLLALIAVMVFVILTSCSVVAHTSTRVTSERKTVQIDTVWIKSANKNYKNLNL